MKLSNPSTFCSCHPVLRFRHTQEHLCTKLVLHLNLSASRLKYKIFQQSCETEKKFKPKSIGILIFDEVKVVSSPIWNSRSHQIVGLAMTEEVQAALHDVFQLFDKNHCTKQTSYNLQFLWRDLTSSFDIVGPYYTIEETMPAKVICSCVFKTIKLFQVCKYT